MELLLFFASLLPLLAHAAPSRQSNPLWYDQGLYGAYPWREYLSFDLASPRVNLLTESTQCDPGHVFLEPRGRSVSTPGPMILDADGSLVYMEKKFGEVMDFRPQSYLGETYLTFWSGTDDGTHGRGTYYMLNSSYDIVHTLTPANGLEGDLHEFELTPDGTALLTIYEIVPADLTSVGGPADGWIYDGLFQEIDVATGALLFEWRASSHYAVNESFAPLKSHGRSADDAWDFFHINSVDKDPATGLYYVSARYTHTITCISPESQNGTVLWRLGGARSSFTDLSNGTASDFSWQHHARHYPGPNGTSIVTIFDNGAYDNNDHLATPHGHSRGLVVRLDTTTSPANMTATLVAALVSPARILAHSQGSVQLLPSGNYFVGWGHSAAYTEFRVPETGGEADVEESAQVRPQVLCDTHFGAAAFFGWGWVKSYRAFKSGEWKGFPNTRPDVAVSRNRLYVSWNGATEVRRWRLMGGAADAAKDDDAEADGEDKWVVLEEVEKSGFEGMLHLAQAGREVEVVRVEALDEAGTVLGVSAVVDRKSGMMVGGAFEPMQDRDTVALQLLLAVLACMTFVLLIWACWIPVRRPLADRAGSYRRVRL
ncbi:arylsulfotransferase protein [Diplodia corticola]|uniref:Arylsulfotransferase protein n=1 Tax=Diplodia corticola TaxID=236234 RepID=A0A1J9QWI6_9PEZI|nr:arylsulfotransferase protein [Diplodia corticola]OJD33350.1 arylsulfotransferase protein [Diplodia corticola]